MYSKYLLVFFLVLQAKEEDLKSMVVIGVDSSAVGGSGDNLVHILFEGDKELDMNAEMWQPFEELLWEKKLIVNVKTKGKKITHMELID